MMMLLWYHWTIPFLSHVSTLTCDIDSKSVCLSVLQSIRPSVCLWRSDIIWKRLKILSQFFHHTIAQSFWFYRHQTSSRNSDRVIPCGGTKYRCGVIISRFSTNKSLYLADDIRYRHSYYGRLIETHTRSIKWCHFNTLNEP